MVVLPFKVIPYSATILMRCCCADTDVSLFFYVKRHIGSYHDRIVFATGSHEEVPVPGHGKLCHGSAYRRHPRSDRLGKRAGRRISMPRTRRRRQRQRRAPATRRHQQRSNSCWRDEDSGFRMASFPREGRRSSGLGLCSYTGRIGTSQKPENIAKVRVRPCKSVCPCTPASRCQILESCTSI